MKTAYTVLSYIAAFTLGCYFVITFGKAPLHPVESFRWVMTIFFGIFFYAMSKAKD